MRLRNKQHVFKLLSYNLLMYLCFIWEGGTYGGNGRGTRIISDAPLCVRLPALQKEGSGSITHLKALSSVALLSLVTNVTKFWRLPAYNPCQHDPDYL